MKYWHLMLATILLISLPAIALTNLTIVRTSESQVLEANRDMMESLATDLEAKFDHHVDDRHSLLIALTAEREMPELADSIVDEFYGGDPAQSERNRYEQLVDRLSIGTNADTSVLLLDAEKGAIVYDTNDDELMGYIPLQSALLSAAWEGDLYAYLPNLPWVSHPSLVMTRAVRNERGLPVAFLCIVIGGPELISMMVTEHDLGPGGGAYLVGPDGRLVTEDPAGGSPGNISDSWGARKALEGASGSHVVEHSDPVIEAYEHVERFDLALVVQMDPSEGAGGLRVIQLSAIAAMAIVAGALLVIAVVLTKNLNRDLGSLVRWSKEVGEGQWDAPLELGPTDEFQDLERSFKNMVRDMAKHQSQLRQAERRFSSLFVNSLDPVYVSRSDGRIAELNPAGEVLLGLPKQGNGTYGYSLEELFVDDEPRREFIGRLEREGAVAGFEAHLQLPSGRELFVLISATRRMDESGRTLSYQGVIHDITDRKRFEEALVGAKNEAEFYCDIMSHDLNNAVQGLGGYLELCNLANDLDDVNQYLPYAQEQMSRASDLLRNVRRLSHLGTQELELKEMDLRKLLIKSVWAVERSHLHDSIDFRMFVPDDNPMVKGESFIEDVFINLMDNAVKYDSHREKVVDIHAGKAEIDGEERWQIRISDRGPGVADRDKQTIFGRFERRALKEYGTGLGLSIVVKAVERSGGRTWVEDRVPGDHTQGATFVVELPAA